MEIKQVTVNRKFNLGNYESLDVGLMAELAPQEKASDIIPKLIAFTESFRPKPKGVAELQERLK